MSAREVQGVNKIVAIASGKGGVGKSTVTANLAAALTSLGKKVGILDADIYGPSQALMLGVPAGTRPTIVGDKQMKPLSANGIFFNSMALLGTNDTPMVWRGPMASGALQQLLFSTLWPDLDVLLIDMPPGTGDIHLTLTQAAPIDGAVVVTTPQDIALIDARKGVEMFNKVSVPTLGIIENMAYYHCDQCGHDDLLFGTGAADTLSEVTQAPLLARIPLHRDIVSQSDSGTPIASTDSPLASHYVDAASQLLRALDDAPNDTANIEFCDE